MRPSTVAPRVLNRAEQAIVVDLLTRLVQDAADPIRFAESLCELLRELTGARTVVVADGHPELDAHEPRLWAVNPSRRRELAKGTAVTELLQLAWRLKEPRLWEADDLLQLDGPCIALPFAIDGRQQAVILLLGLPSLENRDLVLDVLTTISPAITLALTNARQLEDRRAALKSSEARFEAMADRSFDAILTTDREGRITYASPAIQRITGHDPDEILGTFLIELADTDDGGPGIASLSDLKGGEVRHQIPLTLRSRNGGRVMVELNGGPIIREGQFDGLQLSVRDVTEREEARQARLDLERQLAHTQRIESIGRLAGGVAHDFNNMLSVILASTSFLAEELDEGSPLQDDVTEIAQAGRRSADLTRQLLAFSRRQVLRLEVLDLNTIVENLGNMLHRMIREDIELVTLLSPEPGTIEADPGQLEQILMNLAVNARDAMPRGGKLTLETTRVLIDQGFAWHHQNVPPGSHVLLAISDTGLGMEPELLAQIFEPFFTTKDADKGTGLGLATVHGIVKQSKGFIHVSSEPGKGTRFELLFPEVGPREQLAAPAPVSAPAEQPPPAPATVLLVEDEDGVRRAVERILQFGGYRVLQATSGDEALALIEKERPELDLLLTDLVMPEMGGQELAATLLALRPGLKVAFISGYSESAARSQDLLGPDRVFIPKPFTRESLLAALSALLS